ncbi:MAG: type II toxin-antitoxin system VapC family toxin [Mycolicibacterium sp.]|nr:type II toxin-antitoxin system VapC family toxin [Mycolicibacterium sp.]
MLLLDSQCVLWLLDDSPRLGPQARQTISSAQGVYVSAATVWELTIKTMLGKLSVPTELSAVLTEQGLLPLSITAEHAEAVQSIPRIGLTRSVRSALVACLTGPARLAADRRPVLLDFQRSFILDATK